MATRRQERLAQRIKEEVSNIILYELQDPRMGFVTVVRVKLSADLIFARVFVSIMGNEAERKRTLAALNHAVGYIQGLVSSRLGIRRCPTISFALDDTVQKGLRISRLIEQVRQESATTQGGSANSPSAQGEGENHDES